VRAIHARRAIWRISYTASCTQRPPHQTEGAVPQEAGELTAANLEHASITKLVAPLRPRDHDDDPSVHAAAIAAFTMGEMRTYLHTAEGSVVACMWPI